MSNFWEGYPLIDQKLAIVKEAINQQNRSGDKYFNESLDYLVATGGKMLRPAFLLIGGMFGQKETADLTTLATAIETLHLATLVHDDIIDEATLRRGLPTIQSKYSKTYAVYMGDYLFSKCFLMLAKRQVEIGTLEYLARAIAVICQSEMKQNQKRFDSKIHQLDYIKIISGKTAALFAASLSVGAKEADASKEVVKALGKIGYFLGMAFQLVDDLLDYTADEKVLGKEVQADIGRGYYSYPLIAALNTSRGDELKALLSQETLDGDTVKAIIQLTQETGSIQDTITLAQKYTAKAMSILATLDDNPGKTILESIIPILLKRSY